MADSDPLNRPAGASKTRHVGTENDWLVLSVTLDYCKVGNAVVGFDTYAKIGNKSTASPNVKAQHGAKPVYRVGDVASGVLGNAGRGVRSGTSLDSGNVVFQSGQGNVKANGLLVVMEGAKCLMNSITAGVGNVLGFLYTQTKPVNQPNPVARSVQQAGDEGIRVLEGKWHNAKEGLRTLREAFGWSTDDATSAAARSKIFDGSINAGYGLTVLAGPPPDMVEAAYLSGNLNDIALVQDLQRNQVATAGALVGAVEKDVGAAKGRNGTVGAGAMVGTHVAYEVTLAKGTGVIFSGLGKLMELGKAARAAASLRIPSPSRLPSPAAAPKGVSRLIDDIRQSSNSAREAAVRLEKKLQEAQASGKSMEETKRLEKARDDELARAHKEAESEGKRSSDDGIHVDEKANTATNDNSIPPLGPGWKVITPRGPGAATGPLPPGHATVSRWVSPEEAAAWIQNGGTAVPTGIGANNRVYVTALGAAKPGGTGPIRIDFAVSGKALSGAGKPDWYQMFQPMASTPVHNVQIHVPPGTIIPKGKL